MLTGYEDDNHIFKALSAGASGYTLQQTSHRMLLAVLKEVYSGGSPMSSSIARKVVQSFCRPVAGSGTAANLSPREQEVLELLARGFLYYKEIADSLQLSVQTVNTDIRRIYGKLHVRSRAQAVGLYALHPPCRVRALPRVRFKLQLGCGQIGGDSVRTNSSLAFQMIELS